LTCTACPSCRRGCGRGARAGRWRSLEVARLLVVEDQAAALEVACGELALHRTLALEQSVHGGVEIVLVSVGNAERLGESVVVCHQRVVASSVCGQTAKKTVGDGLTACAIGQTSIVRAGQAILVVPRVDGKLDSPT